MLCFGIAQGAAVFYRIYFAVAGKNCLAPFLFGGQGKKGDNIMSPRMSIFLQILLILFCIGLTMGMVLLAEKWM